jgi:hypothetical protein
MHTILRIDVPKLAKPGMIDDPVCLASLSSCRQENMYASIITVHRAKVKFSKHILNGPPPLLSRKYTPP